MHTNKNLPLKMGLSYGAALGVVVISLGIIRYQTGMILRGDQTLSYVYWVIFTITIFFAVFRFKRRNPLFFSLSKTLLIGLFAGLVSGTMYTLYIVILNHYIDPELPSKLIQMNEQALVTENSEISNKELADSFNPMKMSTALRGFIYTMVCMAFGIVHAFMSTIIAKRLKFL